AENGWFIHVLHGNFESVSGSAGDRCSQAGKRQENERQKDEEERSDKQHWGSVSEIIGTCRWRQYIPLSLTRVVVEPSEKKPETRQESPGLKQCFTDYVASNESRYAGLRRQS